MTTATIERCKTLRKRHYPRESWPGIVYETTVASLGTPDATLLEIGCGRAAKRMCRMAERYELGVGLDMETARQPQQANAWLLQGDAHRLPFSDASVDVIACANVIEHLIDPARAFAEAVRILKPGGQLIVMTVNQWFPPIAAARVMPHTLRRWANRLASGTQEEDTFPAYYRANTAAALSQAARSAGLTVCSIKYVCHHPHYLMFSVLAYRAGIMFEKVTRPVAGLRHMIIARFAKPNATNDSNTAHA